MKLMSLICDIWNVMDHNTFKNILKNSGNINMSDFMYSTMDSLLKKNLQEENIQSITYGHDFIDNDNDVIKTGGAYIELTNIDMDINFYQNGSIINFYKNDILIKSISVRKNDINGKDETIFVLIYGRDVNLTLEEIYKL